MKRVSGLTLVDAGADGVNLLNCCGATAWQTVFHFRMHVVPRYPDKALDRLELPFEPGVPGDPEHIQAAGARLRAALT